MYKKPQLFNEPQTSVSQRNLGVLLLKEQRHRLRNKSDHVAKALELMNHEQRKMLKGLRLRDESLQKVNLIQKVLAMDINRSIPNQLRSDRSVSSLDIGRPGSELDCFKLTEIPEPPKFNVQIRKSF